MTSGAEMLRATSWHTPGNLFRGDALRAHSDGGLLVRDSVIATCDDFATVRHAHPDTAVRDLRGGFLLPGMVDTHVHFPQVRVMGSLGLTLLKWLEQSALPEESRMADTGYAAKMAEFFVRALGITRDDHGFGFRVSFRQAQPACSRRPTKRASV